MLKMLLSIICEAPQKISTILKPFLATFTLFHLKNWPYLQKPEFGNLAKTRFWLLLVNNSLCSIPLSCARSYIIETPGDRCAWACLYFQNTSLQTSLLGVRSFTGFTAAAIIISESFKDWNETPVITTLKRSLKPIGLPLRTDDAVVVAMGKCHGRI